MFRFHRILILLVILSEANIILADISAMWEDFWSISCEFSDLVRSGSDREKRSIPLQPNFDDPEELFKYLYPLADVKFDSEMGQEEMRSSHSVSTWIDDAIELWESECHSRIRRQRRSSGDEDQSEPDDDYDRQMPSEMTAKDNVTTTTTTTAAPPPKKEKKIIPDADTFFTQYGGDIEYFFPLISFGIPFDGEITLLGFHGFKGLFPYR